MSIVFWGLDMINNQRDLTSELLMPKQCTVNSITDIADGKGPIWWLTCLFPIEFLIKKREGRQQKRGEPESLSILGSLHWSWHMREKVHTSCPFSGSPLSLLSSKQACCCFCWVPVHPPICLKRWKSYNCCGHHSSRKQHAQWQGDNGRGGWLRSLCVSGFLGICQVNTAAIVV